MSPKQEMDVSRRKKPSRRAGLEFFAGMGLDLNNMTAEQAREEARRAAQVEPADVNDVPEGLDLGQLVALDLAMGANFLEAMEGKQDG